MIAKHTVVAKLSCHDLDEPPNTIQYAPSSGPVGSGQLFEQVPNAENVIQVSTRLHLLGVFLRSDAGTFSKWVSDPAERVWPPLLSY